MGWGGAQARKNAPGEEKEFRGDEVSAVLDMINFKFAHDQVSNQLMNKDYDQVEACTSMMREMLHTLLLMCAHGKGDIKQGGFQLAATLFREPVYMELLNEQLSNFQLRNFTHRCALGNVLRQSHVSLAAAVPPAPDVRCT